MPIQTFEESYTDGIEQHGASTWINFHARIVFSDGSKVWHYWGTPAPQGAVQHQPIHLPADLLALEDANDELYRLAFKIGPKRDGVG